MKHSISAFLVLATAALLLTCCNGGKKPAAAPAETPEKDSVAVVADSTVYGVALESGMSTLCILADGGDTLLLDRDDEEGYGEFYGYVAEGDSFAVTKRKGKDGLVVVKAYNLSLLKTFDAALSVSNGMLVVGGNDTVDVKGIDDDSLVVVSRATKKGQVFYPKKR